MKRASGRTGALDAIREGEADSAAGRHASMEDMRAAVRDRATGA